MVWQGTYKAVLCIRCLSPCKLYRQCEWCCMFLCNVAEILTNLSTLSLAMMLCPERYVSFRIPDQELSVSIR